MAAFVGAAPAALETYSEAAAGYAADALRLNGGRPDPARQPHPGCARTEALAAAR